MQKRRRFNQTVSFRKRLALFAEQVREEASKLPSEVEREAMLRKARQAETASHPDEWANSPGLQPPD